MSEEQKHHPFGPSSMRRRELCPASMRLEKGLPDVSSPDAERGTLIHARVAEMIANRSANPTLSKIEGLTAEAEELASMCYDCFLNSLSDLTPPQTYETERRLQYLINGQVFYFGTADVVILSEVDGRKVGNIIDWKTGYKSVEMAQDNIQGAAYALAAMQELGLDECEVFFYNPTLQEESTYTFTDAEALKRHIIGIYNATCDEAAQPIAGDEQCRYCKAFLNLTCPTVKRDLNEIAERAPTLAGAISTLPDELLIGFFEKGKVVSKLTDVAEKEIKRRCQEFGAVGAYHIKTVSGGFEIASKDILAAFELADCVDNGQFLGCCELKESQLKTVWAKAMKEQGQYKTLKEAEIAFNNRFANLRTPKTERKMLVKAKD